MTLRRSLGAFLALVLLASAAALILMLLPPPVQTSDDEFSQVWRGPHVHFPPPLPEFTPPESFVYSARDLRSPFSPGSKPVGTLRLGDRLFELVETPDGLVHLFPPRAPHATSWAEKPPGAGE